MRPLSFLFFFKFLFLFLFIYLFMAVLGLRFCVRAFSSCGERGPLFIAVRGPLTIAASLVAEHRLQTRKLSSCGSRAQLLRSMWDPPRPGHEPVSPALAGRFSTTAPPGKPLSFILDMGNVGLLSLAVIILAAKFSILLILKSPDFFFEFYFIYFLYSRFLLVTCFINISVYMSSPSPNSSPPNFPPLVSIHLFSMSVNLFLFHR